MLGGVQVVIHIDQARRKALDEVIAMEPDQIHLPNGLLDIQREGEHMFNLIRDQRQMLHSMITGALEGI